jgi:hypothetical protein
MRNHKKYRYLAYLIVTSTIIACASPAPQLQTASGNPEILIPDTDKKQVIDAIIEGKLQKGCQIQSVNDYSIVATKLIDNNLMATILYGSQANVYPMVRQSYNLIQSGNDVKVYSRAEMVTNPGTGYERVSDITQQIANELQNELVRLQLKFANKTD